MTLRCKLKAQEGPNIQLLGVHLPVVVVSRDCKGTTTWMLMVYGGPGSSKYEHVMYENGVAARKGAKWLQALTRVGGASAPPTVVRYMDQKVDQKVDEYIGWKEKDMLGGCTRVKVEELWDEELREPKRLKKDTIILICSSSFRIVRGWACGSLPKLLFENLCSAPNLKNAQQHYRVCFVRESVRNFPTHIGVEVRYL